MAFNGLLCRPRNQPRWGFNACEEEAVCKGSSEMELIPRPWGLDILPLAYTDFGIRESHLTSLLETEVDWSPLLTSGNPFTPQQCYLLGWRQWEQCTYTWQHLLTEHQTLLFSLWAWDLWFGHTPRQKVFSGGCHGQNQQWERAPEKHLSSGCRLFFLVIFLQSNTLQELSSFF